MRSCTVGHMFTTADYASMTGALPAMIMICGTYLFQLEALDLSCEAAQSPTCSFWLMTWSAAAQPQTLLCLLPKGLSAVYMVMWGLATCAHCAA